MTDEKDPFSVLTEKEGISGLSKFCIVSAIVILIFAMYFNGSGKSESYKKLPTSESFSIKELESEEMSYEEVERREQESSKEAEPSSVDEKVSEPEAIKEEPKENTFSQSQKISDENVEKEQKKEPESPQRQESSTSKTSEGEKVSPVSGEQTPDDEKKTTMVEEAVVSYDDIREPLPSGTNWKRKLPDFASLTNVQRMTSIDNALYSEKFNDNKGAISISSELGKPWYYFRRLHTMKNPSAAKISVVMYGLGMNTRNTKFAINSLPAEVTMSFSVYTSDLKDMIASARTAGHETMLDIPFQSEDYPLLDPGDLGILQNFAPGDNTAKLLKMMSFDVPFMGFFSINGEAISVSVPLMTIFTKELMNRGLLFLDANKKTVLGEFKQLPYNRASVVIGEDLFKEQIIAAMEDAKEMAIKNGSAIIAIDSQLLSIYLLRDFINEEIVNNPKIELVPVSLLYNL